MIILSTADQPVMETTDIKLDIPHLTTNINLFSDSSQSETFLLFAFSCSQKVFHLTDKPQLIPKEIKVVL